MSRYSQIIRTHGTFSKHMFYINLPVALATSIINQRKRIQRNDSFSFRKKKISYIRHVSEQRNGKNENTRQTVPTAEIYAISCLVVPYYTSFVRTSVKTQTLDPALITYLYAKHGTAITQNRLFRFGDTSPVILENEHDSALVPACLYKAITSNAEYRYDRAHLLSIW